MKTMKRCLMLLATSLMFGTAAMATPTDDTVTIHHEASGTSSRTIMIRGDNVVSEAHHDVRPDGTVHSTVTTSSGGRVHSVYTRTLPGGGRVISRPRYPASGVPGGGIYRVRSGAI